MFETKKLRYKYAIIQGFSYHKITYNHLLGHGQTDVNGRFHIGQHKVGQVCLIIHFNCQW